MANGPNNVTDLARYRAQTRLARRASDRPERSESRARETRELMDRLRKRVPSEDRPILAANLGRLVEKHAPENPAALAKRLLGSEYQKRKRYLLFPGETLSEKGFYAASGDRFARIIDELAEEAVRQGTSRAEALNQIVRQVLKGTSFRKGSEFQMPEDAGDLAHLCKVISHCLNELAETTVLADYLGRISKYPIWPRDVLAREEAPLEFDCSIVNDFSRDISLEDDEALAGFPWWAPKCVIGHLYVPFECNVLSCSLEKQSKWQKALSDDEIDQIRQECLDASHFDLSLFDRMVSSCLIRAQTIYYRLPVWIAILPSRSGRLAACLYAPIRWYYDRFDWNVDFRPNFVSTIGADRENDVVHDASHFDSGHACGLIDDDLPESYLAIIGPNVENEALQRGLIPIRDLKDFEPELHYGFGSPSEFPEWLNSDPVGRLIPVSAESSWAKRLLLRSRVFPKLAPWCTENISSFFRPAFDDGHELTPLSQNTIGAYLLRNLVHRDSIFEALKQQIAVKAAAVNDLIESELAGYQQALYRRFPPRE